MTGQRQVQIRLRANTTAFQRGVNAARAAVHKFGRQLAEKQRERVRLMHALYRRRQIARGTRNR